MLLGLLPVVERKQLLWPSLNEGIYTIEIYKVLNGKDYVAEHWRKRLTDIWNAPEHMLQFVVISARFRGYFIDMMNGQDFISSRFMPAHRSGHDDQ